MFALGHCPNNFAMPESKYSFFGVRSLRKKLFLINQQAFVGEN